MTAPAVISVTLRRDELEVVLRSIVGNGGHQRLLRKILTRLNRQTGAIELFPQDLADARRYADAYGGGGYQDRFWVLIRAAERGREVR